MQMKDKSLLFLISYQSFSFDFFERISTLSRIFFYLSSYVSTPFSKAIFGRCSAWYSIWISLFLPCFGRCFWRFLVDTTHVDNRNGSNRTWYDGMTCWCIRSSSDFRISYSSTFPRRMRWDFCISPTCNRGNDCTRWIRSMGDILSHVFCWNALWDDYWYDCYKGGRTMSWYRKIIYVLFSK